jgi:SAM-dependent methyltransferase
MAKSKPWYEDDSFWETWSPVIFSEQHLARAREEIDGVISLLGIKPGAYILDLCCGVGRHTLELARRGFQVTGVDRTRSYLDRASRQAEAEGLKVVFVHDDMRTFCRPDTFDACINMFTSFGYFEDPAEDRQVLVNVYRSLKSGGIFILDTIGKEVLARVFRERNWEEGNGIFLLQEHKVSNNWGWMENRWIIFKDNKRIEFKYTHRLYSAVELASLFTECGFRHIDAYGDLSGSAYDHTARRLVMVARK